MKPATGSLSESLDTALCGYRRARPAERSAFGMLCGFASSVAVARGVTYVRERRRPAPRSRSVVRRVARYVPRRRQPRIHHFLPGIGIAYAVAAAAITVREDRREEWLAPAFGVGVGLTLDEFALLLELDDAYWASEEPAIIAVGGAGISALALLARFLRRGGHADVERGGGATDPQPPLAEHPHQAAAG